MFFAQLSFAQEVDKAQLDYNSSTVEYIQAEKQRIKENPQFSDKKFKDIHAGKQSNIPSTATVDVNAIQAKIEYLRSLNCCEAKIEELEAQLAQINN